MPDRSCSVASCERPRLGKSVCRQHYMEARSATMPTCSGVGCELKSITRGYCAKHYERWKVHGDAETVLPSNNATLGFVCSIDGCDRTGKITRGWCGAHYNRWKRSGDPGPVEIKRKSKVKPPCKVGNCERLASSGGHCSSHHQRLLKTGDVDSATPLKPKPSGPRPCAVDGCDRLVNCKGFCRLHYSRWSKTGDPGSVDPRTKFTPEQLVARTNELGRESYQRHREKNLARNRKYHADNRERLQARSRKWRAENPGYQAKKTKEWYAENPERAKEIWRDKRGRRREQEQLTFTMPIQYDRLLAKYGMVCHLCKKTIEKDQMSWDHVIPLARGGTHTEENLKPAHRRCNSLKGAGKGLPRNVPPRPEHPLAAEAS